MIDSGIGRAGQQRKAPGNLDDAFTGGTVGRVTAAGERMKQLTETRDRLLVENAALRRKLARTSEGRVMALIGDLAAIEV